MKIFELTKHCLIPIITSHLWRIQGGVKKLKTFPPPPQKLLNNNIFK